MSDEHDSGVTHEIRAWEVRAEERSFRPYDGGLEFTGVVHRNVAKRRKMFFCTCDRDRHFRKEKTALQHLEEVGALD